MFEVFIDIILLSLLLHATKGLSFGALLHVTIAGGSILLPGKMSFLFASMATIAIFFDDLVLPHTVYNHQYADFLVLCMTFFANAVIVLALSRKLQKSHKIVEEKQADLEKSEWLNRYIIEHLQAGIIVLNEKEKIHVMNDEAKKLLHVHSSALPACLSDITERLQEEYERWFFDSQYEFKPFKVHDEEILIKICTIDPTPAHCLGSFILINSAALMNQQAQELKLLALGQLTGSIANEIRHPLSRIQRAMEHFKASQSFSEESRILFEVIELQSKRIDDLFKSILGLSNGKLPVICAIPLNRWLKQFVEQFKFSGTDHIEIERVDVSDALEVHFDKVHLNQILDNLCDNGLRYSLECTQKASLTIKPWVDSYQKVHLDIIDQGKGISEELVDKIFEPFFTTCSKNGTGLGLYLAKELCEINHCHLSIVPSIERGHFRLTF